MGKMSITTNIPIWVGVKLKNDSHFKCKPKRQWDTYAQCDKNRYLC